MKRHLAGKLFIGFLGMAFLTVGVLWLIQAVIMKDNYLNERIRTITLALQNEAKQEAVDYEALEQSLNVSLIAVSSSGEVAYMSAGTPMRGMMLRHLDLSLLHTGEVQYIRTQMDTEYALTGVNLADGTLYAVFSLVDVDEASRILLGQLWIVTVVLFVCAVTFALILTRIFSRPITRVTQAARDMSQGRLDVSLPVRSQDEIGQLTAALNELGAELQKTEQLRRELIANVSHELRAPLTVIQGFAETVRDVTWPDDEKRTAQLTIVSDEAARLSRVVSDILNYSRLQAGVDPVSDSVFPVCPVLNDMIGRYQMDAGTKDVRLELDCPDISVRFDKEKFVQVAGNLLVNALNHAEPGTVVRIKADARGNHALVSVSNTGEMIPEEELAHIWERFYRSAQIGSPHMGTGLGLSIVKSIMESHAVRFGVSSRNRETVFWFETMPLG